MLGKASESAKMAAESVGDGFDVVPGRRFWTWSSNGWNCKPDTTMYWQRSFRKPSSESTFSKRKFGHERHRRLLPFA
jgi:hypothetical protein